jgi:hypothetical protein
VSLAAEADVRRHVLTDKHTALKDCFYARVRAQDGVPASEAALREQIADLRRKLDDMRGERDEYKQAAQALARALNVLTIENDMWVPITSSTSCDQVIFVDQAADLSVSSDAVQVEINRFG